MKNLIALLATIFISLNISAQNQDISTYIPENITNDNLLWLTAQMTGNSQGNGFTWTDNSGNNNDASQNPGLSPDYIENGINGQPAVDFSSNNPNIVLEIESDGISNSDDYQTRSIAIVMQTSDDTDGTQIIYTEGDKDSNAGLNIYIHDHKLYTGLWNEDEISAFTPGIDINTNTSYLIQIIYDFETQTLKLYKNGSLGAQTTADFAHQGLNGGQISLGGISKDFSSYTQHGAEGDSFQGMIAELALFNLALTEAQMDELADGIGSLYGHGSGTLPVDMLESDVNKINGNNIISWSTASEINNDFFTIERSADMENWHAIGTVTGAGNSKTRLDYEYTDYNAPSGTTYYRIVQTDYDGTREIFKAMSVETKSDADQSIEIINSYSNGDYLNIKFTTESADPVTIQVFTSNGTLISEKTVHPNIGQNNINISMIGANGVHITKLSQHGDFVSKKTMLY